MRERYERPEWVRLVNRMAGAVGGDARRIVPLDADELLETAAASLGGMPRGDLGDPDWPARFASLVDALDRSDLHTTGRLMTREELLRALRSRLLMTLRADADPGLFDEAIEAPVIVTGPARSGTTILFELLWLDPSLRAPLAWEALHPQPLPEDGGDDRRLLWSGCEQELWAVVQPEFAAIHELRSDLPVECVTLDMPSFAGMHWPMIAQLEGWAPDVAVDYDFHRRILQTLQRGRERSTWLLKTPGHLMTLDALFATYPDAWIVQTHRDPAKTMPSTVSTTAMVQWLRRDAVDLQMLAQVISAGFAAALNGSVAVRESERGARFVDVHFQSLMKDPVDTLRRAYDGMGRPFSEAHGERVLQYLSDKPKGKFGTHRYRPEEWGFTADGLREQLAPYISHFAVALE